MVKRVLLVSFFLSELLGRDDSLILRVLEGWVGSSDWPAESMIPLCFFPSLFLLLLGVDDSLIFWGLEDLMGFSGLSAVSTALLLWNYKEINKKFVQLKLFYKIKIYC